MQQNKMAAEGYASFWSGYQHTTQLQENYFPTFFIHELNDCLSLLVLDKENYMFNMDTDYTFSKDLEGISMNVDIIKSGKKKPVFC